MQKSGAEIVIDALEKEGVEVVFGFPGGAIIDVFDRLNQSDRFEFILTRHEQGATHMADGYARATGKVGVVIVTSGPGATNTITGLANAMMDSIPIVVISGQVPTSMIGNDAFQEADVVGISRPVSKHNYLVQTVEELPVLLKNSFHIARTGRPGPVVIDIPKDIQKAVLKNYSYPEKPDLPGYHVQMEPRIENVKTAWELIRAAERPLIYAGGGVINSNAAEELLRFATETNIPVTTTFMGLGAFPENHPLSLLMLGMHGTVYANRAIQSCDLLIAIGARFDDRVTGKIDEFAPHAKIIHMDIDPSSISKNVPVDVDIVGDIQCILRNLNKMIVPCNTKEWVKQITEWKRQFPLWYNHHEDDEIIMPQHVIQMIDQLADDDAIICSEVGQNQMWAAQYYTFTKPRTWISSGGLGTMGFGFPAALGAQRGFPGRMVIDVAGDGSIQMNIQELATAIYYNLPVKIIILNNGWLGMVRQWQDLFYAKNYSGTNLTRPCSKTDAAQSSPTDWTNIDYVPDFSKLSEPYGCWGRKVTKRGELEEAMRECLACDRVAILDVRISREENVYPMVPANASLNQMIQGMA
ncbi:MAG: biosynthetic-type acetolactate synthase large subunit [Candidatus Omnitrophota bacterium]|nr:MAG: biosynthetic-type acetolactate synthase large subunit [Candidatus Omnitrophota bacterium]